MTHLAFVTVICGLLLLVGSGLLTLWPGAAADMVRAFPRQAWAGRILAAVDILWAAWLVLAMGTVWVDTHRAIVYAAVPVFYILVIVFIDDLLAARALGGLLLLVPLPILESAFTHPAFSRLVMTSFAYLLVVLGLVLVWSPFKLRQWTERWINRASAASAVGGCGLLLGAVMLFLAWRVY